MYGVAPDQGCQLNRVLVRWLDNAHYLNHPELRMLIEAGVVFAWRTQMMGGIWGADEVVIR